MGPIPPSFNDWGAPAPPAPQPRGVWGGREPPKAKNKYFIPAKGQPRKIVCDSCCVYYFGARLARLIYSPIRKGVGDVTPFIF
jgi:hypothetical protein